MKDFVVQTRQASKAYGFFYALKQVSMHVKQGDIYGLIGDNGAGKSTLLKLLTGLARATEGEIRLWGKYEEKELKRCRKQIGAMVEQPGLCPDYPQNKIWNIIGSRRGFRAKHAERRF